MFGSVNSEVIKQLEFALQGIRGERGHELEPTYHISQLTRAETNVLQAIRLLTEYGGFEKGRK